MCLSSLMDDSLSKSVYQSSWYGSASGTEVGKKSITSILRFFKRGIFGRKIAVVRPRNAVMAGKKIPRETHRQSLILGCVFHFSEKLLIWTV